MGSVDETFGRNFYTHLYTSSGAVVVRLLLCTNTLTEIELAGVRFLCSSLEKSELQSAITEH